jgi:hypothetical protein
VTCGSGTYCSRFSGTDVCTYGAGFGFAMIVAVLLALSLVVLGLGALGFCKDPDAPPEEPTPVPTPTPTPPPTAPLAGPAPPPGDEVELGENGDPAPHDGSAGPAQNPLDADARLMTGDLGPDGAAGRVGDSSLLPQSASSS